MMDKMVQAFQRLVSMKDAETWAASNIAVDGSSVALFMVRTPVGGLQIPSLSSAEQSRRVVPGKETSDRDFHGAGEAVAAKEAWNTVDRRDPSVVLVARLVDALLIALSQARFTSEDNNVAPEASHQSSL
jgi:TctA family transporter